MILVALSLELTDILQGFQLMAGETKCMVGYHLMAKDHSIQLGVWERGAVSPPAGARQHPGEC